MNKEGDEMEYPKFSVLMSLYIKEKAEYFDECMQSILRETVLPREIVIVYDGAISDNVDYDTINNVKNTTFVQDSCIRISFIGNVRYYNLNIKLLDLLKNDERFRIQFYGTESEKIRDYCVTNGIRNVDFEGRFPFEKTAFFYQKTDLINNIYGNETMEVSTALSNKLYYAAYLDKPILVSNNTYMSDVVKKYNLGYVVDLNNNNLADDIYTWYIQYKENPSTMRQSFIDKIEKEFKDYQEKFKKFIQETS